MPTQSKAISLAFVTAMLAVGVYVNALHNPFVHDDRTEVVENASIRQLTDLSAVVRASLTRPVVMLSYAVDYAVWGLEPFGYHLTNLLLHVLNVLLLFWLVHGLVRDRASDNGSAGTRAPATAIVTAFAAACLFAVHPMMTEAVGYVSGRSELLSGVFFLSSLLCFRQAFVAGGRLWLVPGIVLFVIGLGAKETMAMLPIVLLAYDGLLLRRSGEAARRRLWRVHAPLLLAVLLLGAWRVWLYTAVEHPASSGLQWEYGLVELHVAIRYISLLLYPSSLSIVQPVYPIESIYDERVAISVAALTFLGAAAVELRRRNPLVTFGITWFFVLLVPSASLILLAAVGEPMAEHRVYLASAGFFMAVGALVGRWAERGEVLARGRLMAAAAALMLGVAALGTLTVARNRVWESPMRLWEDAASKAPRTWMAVYGMADAYRAVGDNVSAAVAYQRAIALRPTETRAYLGLAQSWIDLGRNESAREALRAAIQRRPAATDARMALALVEEQVFRDSVEARRLCREVLELAPAAADAVACIRRNPVSAAP